ncbi:hypothetical protein [Cellulomonas dongxiuzhuiae]|uniref:DUF3137 domain-containing protein n=1 Tax=Cellulomonas dongxiuzhuiae TaxID=2819979 RepID=A0ABX8GHZ5_9CELL|nr:hypothetical protein [Cellulomonas dongxiuzhuiae]MBO3088126.1 hypothetical protein [Cellulomonas dongxiuzhuiae]MBO3094527.1 hypothetical protein [Cellulomonas dongxiuzhuiae]QWC15550.1 hypothetical protein KKR89_14815 [Cellulomonas dongxiuzhuiae]
MLSGIVALWTLGIGYVVLTRMSLGASEVVLFVVAALVGPVVAWLAHRWQRRRHDRLAAWAGLNGWEYARSDGELERIQTGVPFSSGDSHAAIEVMRRDWQGRPAVSFTYRWVTGAGKNRSTSYAHVVALRLPAYLPRLEVTAEGVGARLAKLAGGKDLQLELEAFNREYRVVASDVRTAHAVLHPRLLERLLRPDALGRPWRIEGTWLVTWDDGRTDVDRVAAGLMLLNAVADAVPRHVWQDHGHDPAGTLGAPRTP